MTSHIPDVGVRSSSRSSLVGSFGSSSSPNGSYRGDDSPTFVRSGRGDLRASRWWLDKVLAHKHAVRTPPTVHSAAAAAAPPPAPASLSLTLLTSRRDAAALPSEGTLTPPRERACCGHYRHDAEWLLADCSPSITTTTSPYSVVHSPPSSSVPPPLWHCGTPGHGRS